jgi:hypothetical protein
MAFAGLLVFGAETGNDAQACPPEFRVSSPQPRAPDPTKLAYRTTTTTGSFTDSDRAVEGERYRDFALRASQQDSAFATFRQTYYSRHYAGIETDEKAKWNSAFRLLRAARRGHAQEDWTERSACPSASHDREA